VLILEEGGKVMGIVGRVGAVVLTGLLCVVFAQAEDVVKDLSTVQHMDHYKGPDQGKDLLKQNGFVVVQQFFHRISGPYADETIPHYVTTDSVYATFHVIFEDLLKQVETACAEQVLQITQQTRQALKTVSAEGVPGVLAGDAEAGELAGLYFQVAECLLSEKEVPADTPAVVREEMTLVWRPTESAPRRCSSTKPTTASSSRGDSTRLA